MAVAESPRSRYRMRARARAAAKTGDRILAAARELFAEQFYDQVSIESVAARAGVTVRTVLRRFTSKAHLFAMAAEARAALIREERTRTSPDDVPGALAALAASYERWGDGVLNFLAQERRTPAIAAVVGRGRSYHQQWVERIFQPGLQGVSPAVRRRRLAELTAATDVYAWKVLRRDLGLTPLQARRAIAEMAERIAGRQDGG